MRALILFMIAIGFCQWHYWLAVDTHFATPVLFGLTLLPSVSLWILSKHPISSPLRSQFQILSAVLLLFTVFQFSEMMEFTKLSYKVVALGFTLTILSALIWSRLLFSLAVLITVIGGNLAVLEGTSFISMIVLMVFLFVILVYTGTSYATSAVWIIGIVDLIALMIYRQLGPSFLILSCLAVFLAAHFASILLMKRNPIGMEFFRTLRWLSMQASLVGLTALTNPKVWALGYTPELFLSANVLASIQLGISLFLSFQIFRSQNRFNLLLMSLELLLVGILSSHFFITWVCLAGILGLKMIKENQNAIRAS